MNRKERRALEKSGKENKTVKPILPVAPMSIEILKLRHPELALALTKYEEKCKLDASNEVFNLIFACVLVALHDKFNFNADQLNKLVSEGINQLDCVSSGFVTKYDMIGLISELGVKVEDLELEKITHNAQQTHERLKYYFGEVEEMTRKEQAFELFEKGVFDAKVIVEQIGGSEQSIPKYKSLWKQAKLENMSVDEFTERLLGVSAPVTEENKPQEVEMIREDELVVEEKETVKNENRSEKQEPLQEKKLILEVPKKPSKFEVKKTIEITAEFGTYTIQNNIVDVMLETREMGLTKADLQAFAEELLAVAEEM